MCYYVDAKLSVNQIKDAFGVLYSGPQYEGSSFTNGFSHPDIPIILDENPGEALLGNWGIIPSWAKNRESQKMTLNAKIETIAEKPFFKASVDRRCLVLVNGFYEWKWLDAKGKSKERYYIQLDNGGEPFALGGIYNIWQDKETNEVLTTFSIITTEANEIMAEIHNTKHRMPLILDRSISKSWLEDQPLENFAFPHYDPKLMVQAI